MVNSEIQKCVHTHAHTHIYVNQDKGTSVFNK